MYTVLDKTAFDFTSLAAGVPLTVVLGRLCGLPPRTPARLAVRIHERDFTSGTNVQVQIFPTIELPGGDSWFTGAEPWLGLTIDDTRIAPSVQIASSSRALPPSVCAKLIGTYGGSSGGTITVSAELVL